MAAFLDILIQLFFLNNSALSQIGNRHRKHTHGRIHAHNKECAAYVCMKPSDMNLYSRTTTQCDAHTCSSATVPTVNLYFSAGVCLLLELKQKAHLSTSSQ